jgi:hypothetical protein
MFHKKLIGNDRKLVGITAANESPSGAESNDQYADNIKYLSLTGAEKFEGTIEAILLLQ